jgi:hypothetical protein
MVSQVPTPRGRENMVFHPRNSKAAVILFIGEKCHSEGLTQQWQMLTEKCKPLAETLNLAYIAVFTS